MMPIFLIDTDTFKKSYLGGAGNLVLKSDQDLWAALIATGGKFLPTVDRVVGFDHQQAFRFGRHDGLQLTVSAKSGHQIQLIWPGQEDPILKTYQLGEFLTEGKLYLRLLIRAGGALAAGFQFPTGALS